MIISANVRDYIKKIIKLIKKVEFPFLCNFGQNPQKLSEEQSRRIINQLTDNIYIQTVSENKLKIKYDLMIVVAAYNCEKTIQECVESVLKQETKYSFELVIVNDGSTDNTGKILSKYTNMSNVKVINQSNKGLSGARNKTLQELDGRYVFFLDSDDYLPRNDAIEKLLNCAYEKNADIVEGTAFSFFENGKKNRDMTHRYIGKVKKDTDLYGYPWGKIYRSELFKKIIFPTGLWFEDTLISMIIYPLAKTKYIIKDYVYAYRINQNGITHSSRGKSKSIDTFIITEELVKLQSDLNLINSDTEQLFLNQMAMNYMRLKGLDKKVNSAVIVQSLLLYNKYFKSLKMTNDFSNKQIMLKKSLDDQNLKKVNAILDCWSYLD